jgi:hypothetical protein
MSKDVTIAIINRGGRDTHLIETCNNALEVANGATVALVIDGRCKLPAIPKGVQVRFASETPEGTSRTRHHAVMSSSTPYVITCDSHVVMQQGFPQSVANHLAQFRDHVLCARCEMLPNGGIYQGARLNTLVPPDPKQGSTNKCEGEFQAIAAQWRPDDERAGPISSIMGGCYAIGREWYTAIGQPWQYGRGWGCDEETISIASQAHGGKAWMLPDVVGHWMQRQAQYRQTPLDSVCVWVNRLRVLLTAPMNDKQREETQAYLMSSTFFVSERRKQLTLEMLAEIPIEAIREAQAQGPTLDQMKEGIPMKRPELIEALKQNNVDVKGVGRMKLEQLQKLWADMSKTMDARPITVVAVVEEMPPPPEPDFPLSTNRSR